MKLPNSSKKNRSWLLPVIVITILAALVSGYLLYAYSQSTNKQSDKESSSQDIQNNKKPSSNPSEGLPSNSDNTTSQNVPTDSTLSISQVLFSQKNSMINASAQVNQAGTCVFVFKPADNGKPITSEVVVKDNSCAASLPENQFVFIGNWELTVTLYSNGKKTQIEQNVTIK